MKNAMNYAMSALVLPLLLSAAACSGSSFPATAPSGTTAVSPEATSDKHGAPSAPSAPSANSGNQAELSGIVQTSTGACPALRLTVNGKVVTTSAATEFHDGACTDVRAGANVEVKGTAEADGRITASRIELRGAARENEPNDPDTATEVTGAIANKAGTCPALTLIVGTTTVRTTAETVFHEVTCAALAAGVVVEAKGAAQTDGSLVAALIERQEP